MYPFTSGRRSGRGSFTPPDASWLWAETGIPDLLPRIRETRQKLVEMDKDWEKEDNDLKRDILAIDKLIAAIEADKNPAPVRSMEEFTGTRTRP